jgi:hypothetical protein
MKKTPIYWAVIFCLAAVLPQSCKTKPSIQEETAYHIPVHTEETVIPLNPEDGEASPQMTLYIDLADPPPSLKDLIHELLYDSAEPDAYARRLVEDYKNDYLGMHEYVQEEGLDRSATLNWYYAETLMAESVPFRSTRLLKIRRTQERYTGGAHGVWTTQYFMIDPEQKKRITLAEVVKASEFPTLNRRIEEELRKLADLPPGTPLSEGGFFEDQVEIPDNFFLSPQGLGFHWNLYEIAPYVMGSIEAEIPFEQIQDILISR